MQFKKRLVYVKPDTPVMQTIIAELIKTLVGRVHTYGMFKKIADGLG